MSDASDAAARAMDVGEARRGVDLLHRAARGGDMDAVATLAFWQLAGEVLPRDLPAARTSLRRAAGAGHEGAALSEIALAANGTGGPPDWATACALLRAAADRYGGAAAADLALLDGMALGPQGEPLSLPQAETLGTCPTVRRWRGLLTPAECAHLAGAAQALLAPSMVADPATGRLIAHPIRTSSAAVIGPTRETLPIQAILRRIAAATGTDPRAGEPLSILHYGPGQQYRPHMDVLPHEANQRAMTVIVYLNGGYAGGETAFAASGLAVAGSGGDAIAFANLLDDGRPDPASRHAGLPLRQGTKWVATRWIRRHPFDVWNAGAGRTA